MRDARWLALAIVVSGVMQAPFTNFIDFGSALAQGDGRVQAWVLAWVAHALSGGAALFDANMFYPAPRALAHTDHMVALGALALPLWLLTHNAVLVFNIFKILGPALSVWAAARLAFAWTRDGAASLVAAVAFGCASFTLLHNAHLNLTWSAGIPLAILAFERWWQQPAWSRVLPWWAAVVFTSLVSWYLAVMIAVALSVWLVVLLVGSRGNKVAFRDNQARALQLASSAILAIAVLLPFAAPYFGRGSETGESVAYAATWQSYLVPHEHTIAGRWLVSANLANPQGIWGEHSLFLGWTVVALAAAGAVHALKSAEQFRRAAFLIVMGAIAAALSFGPSSTGLAPFDWIEAIPALSGFRATARFALLVTLSSAMLAAFGLAWLRARAPRARLPLAAACLAAVVAEPFIVDFPGGRPRAENMPEMYAEAVADGARAAVALPMYAGQSIWYLEGDYLLYSTSAQFVRLANGIGRWVPDSYLALGDVTRTFPSAECANALRYYGITHVLFHGERFVDRAAEVLARARESRDFTVVSTHGSDALLRVDER